MRVLRLNRHAAALTMVWAMAFAQTGSAQIVRQGVHDDPFAPEQVLAFADHLSRRGDCHRALAEYERYLFSARSFQRSRAHFQIATCLVGLSRPDEAADHFLSAMLTAHRPAFRDSSFIAYLGALVQADRPDVFFHAVDTGRTAGYVPHLQSRIQNLRVLMHLYQGEIDAAANALNNWQRNLTEVSPEMDRLRWLLEDGRNLPRKSGMLAGFLSAIVPGTGKIYARRASDGLYSLALIAGMGWLAYDGFEQRGADSFKGWFFGTMGTALYVGNIYGSMVAVRLYNEHHLQAHKDAIRLQITIAGRL